MKKHKHTPEDPEIRQATTAELADLPQAALTVIESNASQALGSPDQMRDLGRALIVEAAERTRDNLREAVVLAIASLIELRGDANAMLEAIQYRIKFFDRKLAALNAGEFTITRGGQIFYNDEELNKNV